MSREERRAYKRMTRNQDPYALPASAAAKVKAQRQRSRRPSRPAGGEFTFVTRRFLVWALGGAAAAFLMAFSLAWPSGMPFALYVGVAAGAAWVALAWLVRFAMARSAARR